MRRDLSASAIAAETTVPQKVHSRALVGAPLSIAKSRP
jgi:hypothetical protein